MRRLLSLVAIALAVCLTGGCFEEAYMSQAPDGTIALCYGERMFYVNPDLTAAEIAMPWKTTRAEFSPDGNWLLVVTEQGSDKERYLEYALRNREGTSMSLIARLAIGPGTDFGDLPVAAQMVSPRWSPDGRFFSYLLPNPVTKDFRDLHINEAHGPYHFVIPKVSAGYSWSRDSKRVAVISTNSEDPNSLALGSVQVWDVVAQNKVSEPAGVLCGPFFWTGWTDSGDLLFSSQHIEMPTLAGVEPKDLSLNIYRYCETGKSKAMSALLPGGLGSPDIGAGLFDVSPDGKRIAYIVWGPKNERTQGDDDWNLGSICISNSDGSDEQKLSEHVWIGTLPRWLSNNRVGCVVETEKGPSDNGKEIHVYLFDIGGKTTDLMPLIQPLVEKEKTKEAAESAKKQAEAPKNATVPAASTESTVRGLFR